MLDPRFAGRSLGGLLLDQGFLAGMGNYLRSEVLFAANLLPQRRPRDLDAGERAALVRELLAIPSHNYDTRGLEPARRLPDDYLTDPPGGFRFRVIGPDRRTHPPSGGPHHPRKPPP